MLCHHATTSPTSSATKCAAAAAADRQQQQTNVGKRINASEKKQPTTGCVYWLCMRTNRLKWGLEGGALLCAMLELRMMCGQRALEMVHWTAHHSELTCRAIIHSEKLTSCFILLLCTQQHSVRLIVRSSILSVSLQKTLVQQSMLTNWHGLLSLTEFNDNTCCNDKHKCYEFNEHKCWFNGVN